MLDDKGYHADWFRQALADRGITACIPSKSNPKAPLEHDRSLYRQSHKIELSNSCSAIAFAGGGQLGVQQEERPGVFGLETDFHYCSGSGGFLRTTRGRLGYAFNNAWMLHAKVGLAPQRSQSHLVRLGVNYRFNSDGPSPVVARRRQAS